MAVIIINGDLLTASEDIIGHQVNCKGVMGSGVAKLIKEKYPEAFTVYKEKCNEIVDKQELLGICQLVECAEGKTVANLFGQLKYGRGKEQYTDYAALEKALNELKNRARKANSSIALPFNIGCGLANGSWDVVSKMIEEIYSDYDVTLYKL
ncbi:Appr-1-p processing protein [Brevibacillus reuszeri]|uniref:Appr-1-p processing protein n=1 Tax=Brevibacillus reuszeri TaxID=54915 RepID=A0A0K9YU99_9BACL|nr:macro domain-containing protein [Brevibacillus reuszeri]KNB72294.1 Appr-1-p processing protein [Brevibacillus reuszeri]MED1861063.1 macro domain-containing protein [Brevibacillus reuszeri]GED72872.1 Appr-1-p processing protein [Brevibacillus reuszeri]